MVEIHRVSSGMLGIGYEQSVKLIVMTACMKRVSHQPDQYHYNRAYPGTVERQPQPY
jgi:hypothetical protein